MMKKYFFLLVFLVSLSCDDGDVISLQIDFDDSLSLCGDENSADYILYNTKSDPFQSLTLLFDSNASTTAIFSPTSSGIGGSFQINGSTTRFNFRSYTGDPNSFICESIPDASVNVIEDYEATSGTVFYTSSFVDDDNDGIPTALEFNGDSDGDGIPNYKDNDDDGDNVSTANEKPDPNGDGDLTDAQDSDSDGIPDYLDPDDDGDGTLTIYEDENTNGNLFDDIATGGVVARFLDNTVNESFLHEVRNDNLFLRTVKVIFSVENIDLEILATDYLDLGTYTANPQTITTSF